MDKELDKRIREKFQEDNYIPETTKTKISEILEANRTISVDVKNGGIRMKKLMSVLATMMIVFLGANVYAYSVGKNNIFSIMQEMLNINNEKYENEKIEINESKTTENNQILTLSDFAYNSEILIVNYIYKSNNSNYNNIILQEDLDKMCKMEETEGSEYPEYEIATRTKREDNGEYYICKVYDINNLRKDNDKINIIIQEISNLNGENLEEIEKCNLEFSIDISKDSSISKEFKVSNSKIELNLKDMENKNKINKFGTEEMIVQSVINTNFSGLIYLNSDLDLTIFKGMEDGYENYVSPEYSFEITDENGKILNARDSQKLILSMDEKEQVLIVNSLEESKVLNIKIYEEVTDTLVGESKLAIE